jgi:serine protease Do
MSFVEKLRTQKLLSFTLVLFTLSIGIVIGTLISSGVRAAKDNAAAPGATALQIPSPVELSSTFSQIAKQVEPSVVNISTTYNPKPTSRSSRNRRRLQDPDEDQADPNDFLFRFFGSPFGDLPEMSRRGPALGSGVVVDKAGYILTNNHVVDKADRIQVKFNDDPTEYDAKVVGVDVPTDLAVIRVEGKSNLVPAKIGNSDAVQVGDWCIAIGSPFGFQATVTAGIVSAKERDIPGENSQFQHFLQTDAAINPGNSGGPLLNIRGEVIGINTAIASRSGGYQGIGFALPINTAAQVYNAIIKNGKVTRGSIGITFDGNPERAQALLKAYHANSGVFVQDVAEGGPAEKAGVKPGDVIISVNGKPVRDGRELVNVVTATPVGSSLDLTVLRNGQRMNYKVTVGDLAQVFPDRFGNPDDQSTSPTSAGATSFGMQIQNLSAQQRQAMGIKENGGVLVTEVEPNSFAEDIGLQQGDVLLMINQQPINSTADVINAKSKLKPGDAVAFRVLSKGNGNTWTATFLAGTLPNSSQK